MHSDIGSTAETEARWQVVENDEGLSIAEGDRPVLFYQRRPKDLDGRYRRANYIHPLYDLDGRVLTEDFPQDHRHHRGIFWAWHQLWVGDRKLGDGWATRDFDWEVTALEVTEQTPQAVAFRVTVLWKSPDFVDAAGRPIPVVEEQTLVRVHRQCESQRRIDFDIRLKALVPDVRLGGSEDAKGYGGFSVRVQLPEGLRFRGIDGPVEPQTNAVEAGPWLDLAAEDWGVAILVHPSNPGYPQPWILRRERSMQNPAYPGREAVPLKQDEPWRLRYRLIVHRGQLEPPSIDQLQQAYGKEQ